jgi:hypothetical protein
MRLLSAVALACCVQAHSSSVEETKRVPGVVDGFSGLRSDGILDGALVLPSFREDKILAFELNSFLYPSEPMRAGPMNPKVPGNLFFPSQRENYGLLPITIEKPSFSYVAKPGQSDELSGFWFSIPFDRLTDAAQNPLELKKALAQLRLRRFVFESDRDWTQLSRIPLSLKYQSQPSQAYRWTKSAGAANEIDLSLRLQATAAGRWALVDIQSPADSGNLGGLLNLESEAKNLFGRIELSKDGKAFRGARFFVRPSSQTPVSVEGLPSPLALTLSRDRVQWQDLAQPAWIRVQVQRQKKQAQELDPLSWALSFGLRPWIEVVTLWTSPWVPSFVGSAAFNSPLQSGDSVIATWVDTPEQVAVEDLMAYASQIRVTRLSDF